MSPASTRPACRAWRSSPASHADYHKPSDTADKINYEDLDRIVDMAAVARPTVADADEAPQFTKVEQPASRGKPCRRSRVHRHDSRLRHRGERAAAWRASSAAVRPNRRASEGRHHRGDRRPDDHQYLRLHLRAGAAAGDQPVKVVYMRNGEKRRDDVDAGGPALEQLFEPSPARIAPSSAIRILCLSRRAVGRSSTSTGP